MKGGSEILTDFSHPAATEEEPIMWLPRDPLGLVCEVEQELISKHIQYSTEGATIGSNGCIDVATASPEEVRRAPTEARLNHKSMRETLVESSA
jgi:hypothetical protein